MLQVTPDGRLMAYTADKGEKVLELQTGLKGGMSPPVTWRVVLGRYPPSLAGCTCVP